MAIAQPTNDVAPSEPKTPSYGATSAGTSFPKIPDEIGTAVNGLRSAASGASGNVPNPVAGPTPTPSGWRPIELDLPVPGGSPYHFDAQNQAGIQPAVQGYRTAVEAGVRGLIGQPLQQVEQQLGAGHPLLQQFFDYLKQLVERQGNGQFHLPGGGPNGPIESGPRPPVAYPGGPGGPPGTPGNGPLPTGQFPPRTNIGGIHPLDHFFRNIINPGGPMTPRPPVATPGPIPANVNGA